MYSVNIICVGKLKENYLKQACEEYIKRLKAFCKLNIIELSEHKSCDNPSDSEIKIVLQNEGKNIISKLSNNSYVIAMCIEGKIISSEQLAEQISQVGVMGKSNIDFVIGGSYGLSDDVKTLSNFKLSMSEMTFPHQLARVMVLEQIYRSFNINNNGKYHK